MEAIKRRVRVTAEYEVDITIMPSMFGQMSIEQFLEMWRKGLWDVEGIDDVAMYAACMAALCGDGQYDGIWELRSIFSSEADTANVKYRILSEDFDSEIINGDV